MRWESSRERSRSPTLFDRFAFQDRFESGVNVFAQHSKISLKVCIPLFSVDNRFTKLGRCGSYKTELVKYRTADSTDANKMVLKAPVASADSTGT